MPSQFYADFAAIAEPSLDEALGEAIEINGAPAVGRASVIAETEIGQREGMVNSREVRITSQTAMAISDLITFRGATYIVQSIDRTATSYCATCVLQTVVERSKQDYRA